MINSAAFSCPLNVLVTEKPGRGPGKGGARRFGQRSGGHGTGPDHRLGYSHGPQKPLHGARFPLQGQLPVRRRPAFSRSRVGRVPQTNAVVLNWWVGTQKWVADPFQWVVGLCLVKEMLEKRKKTECHSSSLTVDGDNAL